MPGVILPVIYEPIYRLFGGNKLLISVVGTYIVTLTSFWIIGGLFLIVDVTGKPDWIARYKVQTDKNVPIDRQKLKKAIKTIAFNNVVLNALFSYPMYQGQMRAGCGFAVEELPNLPIIIRDFAVFIVVQEIIFYYSHRLFHHPWIYKTVHSQHHSWTAPIGIGSIYTSSIEYLTGNGLSVYLGPRLMGSHIMLFWIWFTAAHATTIIYHSGYHLPLFPSPQFHDFHHLTFNYNFGTHGFLDRLHGTDAKFRGSIQQKRHMMLRGRRPMHVIFPDPDAVREPTSNGHTTSSSSTKPAAAPTAS